MIHLTLPGRPITKKNSQDIVYNPQTKKRKVIPSKQYRVYEEACLWELKSYRGKKLEKTWVNLQAVYYMPNRRSWPDLTGLLQATCDILEKAEIIDNDKYFYSFNGSHIAGVDKDRPRVEIEIAKIRGD